MLLLDAMSCVVMHRSLLQLLLPPRPQLMAATRNHHPLSHLLHPAHVHVVFCRSLLQLLLPPRTQPMAATLAVSTPFSPFLHLAHVPVLFCRSLQQLLLPPRTQPMAATHKQHPLFISLASCTCSCLVLQVPTAAAATAQDATNGCCSRPLYMIDKTITLCCCHLSCIMHSPYCSCCYRPGRNPWLPHLHSAAPVHISCILHMFLSFVAGPYCSCCYRPGRNQGCHSQSAPPFDTDTKNTICCCDLSCILHRSLLQLLLPPWPQPMVATLAFSTLFLQSTVE
jgi:hypothetical protein